jgi:hypothetical protein
MIDYSKKILCLSTTDFGGAGRAAVRTVQGLSFAGANLDFHVAQSKTDLPVNSFSVNSRSNYVKFKIIIMD